MISSDVYERFEFVYQKMDEMKIEFCWMFSVRVGSYPGWNIFQECSALSTLRMLVFKFVQKWSKSFERGLKRYNEKQTILLDL